MIFRNFRRDIILSTIDRFQECFKEYDGKIELIDPIENSKIGFHYSETHFAVAMIIAGIYLEKEEFYKKGCKLLETYLDSIEDYQKNPAYHWDFNNFALCVLVDYIERHHITGFPIPTDDIKQLIIKQKDSNHGTINWMPMRAYTNWCKYSWTKEDIYLRKTNEYLGNVEKALNQDGFFEDFLPKGKSFNFQYHIYTTALLLFLNKRIPNLKLQSLSIKQCGEIIDFDGDINYLGRGCNQLFAWGPILYVFYISNQKEELQRVVQFFEKRYTASLANYNILLNENAGKDRIWWWDYHYASVYYGHLLFWLTLTFIDEVEAWSLKDEKKPQNDSGVYIHHTDQFFVCVFNGRKTYLAEKGPILANVGIKDIGTVFKGPLGPFGGKFGNKYADYASTIDNYFGPVKTGIVGHSYWKKAVFPKRIDVIEEEHSLAIRFILAHRTTDLYFSLPAMCDLNKTRILVYADNDQQTLVNVGNFYGPYGMTNHFQTRCFTAKEILVKIQVK